MLDLEESMLLGLRQHDDDPEADDTRFAAQAGSLDNEDCFDLDPDAIPTQNYSPDQPRDHGKWISDAAFGNVTHADIDSAGLPKGIEHRAHEALGRHERGEEIGRIAREAAESPQRPIPSGPSYEGKPAADAPKAREAAAEPLAGTHGEQLRELYSRAGQLRTTHDQIEQHVAMLKTLPKVDVVSAAREMGVEDHHLASKDRAIARVAKKLTDRLGHAERGAEIEAAARPTQNVFCPTGDGGGVDPSCSPNNYSNFNDGKIEGFPNGQPTGLGTSLDESITGKFNAGLKKTFDKATTLYRGTNLSQDAIFQQLNDIEKGEIKGGGWAMGNRKFVGKSSTVSFTVAPEVARTFGAENSGRSAVFEFDKSKIHGDLQPFKYPVGGSNSLMWEREITGSGIRAGLNSIKRIVLTTMTGTFDNQSDYDENQTSVEELAKAITKKYGVRTEIVHRDDRYKGV